jgi:hypothetical protein
MSTSGRNVMFPVWEEWICEESRRRQVTLHYAVSRLIMVIFRTLILLYIIDMLVETNIGAVPVTGCSQLDQILLPCSKAMWEAEQKSTWEAEYMKYLNTRKTREMLKCGHLRLMKEVDQNAIGSDMEEDLSTWSKGIDNFGALVLMVMQR